MATKKQMEGILMNLEDLRNQIRKAYPYRDDDPLWVHWKQMRDIMRTRYYDVLPEARLSSNTGGPT
jgi:hypothetical protein